MTSYGGNTRPLPFIGQAVGQAQASLTKLLTGILAGTGTSYRVWLGLQRLNALGGEPAREAYEADLSYWLQLDGPAAARLAGDVVAAGLAATGERRVPSHSAPGPGRCARRSSRPPPRSPARCWPRSTAPSWTPPSGRWRRSPGWPGRYRPARSHGGKPMTTQKLPGTEPPGTAPATPT